MRYLLSIIILAFLFGCGSGDAGKAPCASSPSAIFSDTMDVVKFQKFEANGQESFEEAILVNDLKIEVMQSGCELLTQEFRITRKGDFSKMTDPNWVGAAFQTLGVLSQSSPNLGGLKGFADAIASQSGDVRLGEPFLPDPMTSITVDKVSNSEEGTIIVILKELDGE